MQGWAITGNCNLIQYISILYNKTVVVCSFNLNQNKVMNVVPQGKAKVRSDIQEDGGPIVFLLTQVLSWNQHLIEHNVRVNKNPKSNATFLWPNFWSFIRILNFLVTIVTKLQAVSSRLKRGCESSRLKRECTSNSINKDGWPHTWPLYEWGQNNGCLRGAG